MYAIVRTNRGDALVGVGDAHCIGFIHFGQRLVQFHPFNCSTLVSRLNSAARRLASEYERNDPPLHVLINATQLGDFDQDAGLFHYFATYALFESLIDFKDATRRLPLSVVSSLDHQNPMLIVNNDASDAHRMLGHLTHSLLPIGVLMRYAITRLDVWRSFMQLGSVDRSSDRSPSKQIADDLRALITSGSLPPGERLPSEAALIEHYGVARMTVRQALQELRGEGLVFAEHGKGVFVQRKAPVRRLASDRFARRHREQGKAAFLAEAEKAGAQASVDRIRVEEREPSTEVQERLRINASEPVVVRSRRYLADGIPVETAVSYIPAEIARGTAISERDTGPGGIYARLEEAGHTLDHFVEEVTARMPSQEERDALRLGASVPIMRVVRTAFDTTGRAVEVCDTIKAAPSYVLEYDFPAR